MSSPLFPAVGADGRLPEKHLPVHLSETDLHATYATPAGVAADIANPGSTIGAALAVDFMPVVPPAKLVAPYQAIYSDLPIVVLRLDDNREIDLTLATEMFNRNLVGSFAVNNARLNTPGYLTTANLLAMQRQGHEIMAHSRTHGANPASAAEYYDEVVTAADELRALGLQIQCFTQPGTWSSGPYWMDDLAKLDTYQGKILRKNFAASLGYIKDGPIDGMRDIPAVSHWGANHITWETGGVASVQAQVEKTISRNGNLEILTHANTLGTTGNNTVADYTDFLTWLAAQRDAGRLRVMTATAALYAQPGTPRNLLSDPSFETFATAPANTLWVRPGTAHAAEDGRLSGKSVRITAGTGSTIRHEFAAAQTLRTLEVSGWAKGYTAAATARILITPYNAANQTQTVYSKTFAVPADTWTHCRFNIGIPPDYARVRFDFGANTGSADVLWDDVAATRI